MWFYDHYKYFSPLLQIEEQESEEGSDSEEEESDEEGNLAFHFLGQKVKLEDEISVPKATYSRTSFPDEELLCKDEMSVPQEKHSASRIPFYDEELPRVGEPSIPEGRHSDFNFSFPEKVDASTFTEVTELLSQLHLQHSHVVSSLIKHIQAQIANAKRMRNISLVISILFPFTFSLLGSISVAILESAFCLIYFNIFCFLETFFYVCK